jgi:hypothetical protein
MRQLFIYKYQAGDAKKKEEFIELFEKEADKWE